MTKAILLDENFPRAVANGLIVAGHDVEAVASSAPGLNDRGVLALARSRQRWLLTFDSDFGELVFHRGAEPPPAILFFRVHPIVVADVLDLALRALEEVPTGVFAVVTREGTRSRPFQVASAPVAADEQSPDGAR